MSTIDQAFIRAYATDEQASAAVGPIGAPAAPHFRPSSAAAAPSMNASGARQPLSAFVQPGPAVDGRFKPSFEVDAFRWSGVCDDLVGRHAPRLQSLVQAVVEADDAGRSLIGVGGTAVGAGTTTLVSSLARLLVKAGKSVAMVDADFATAGLAESLGLVVEIGWEDVLAGRVPLAESVIYSLADRLVLVPLVAGGAPAAEKLDAIHASVTAGVLRYQYDVVLFDLGCLADPAGAATARRVARQCRLDGLVIADATRNSASCFTLRMELASELATLCLGVVENQLHAA